VQFAAGREQVFFYDGGRAVRVPRASQLRALDRIGEVLRGADADVVLLQEVDRGSDRTDRVDQHAELLLRAPYPCHASTWYYRNPYVPHPTWEHLGRTEVHLSVFSRFQLRSGRRYRLAEMREPWLHRQFNLRRALLELDLPVEGGGFARITNTHLSAFSKGDGTLPEQLATLRARLEAADREGVPWLVGGDFNALPPGDDPSRLGPDAVLYSDQGCPLEPLFERWQSVVPAEAHRDEPDRWRTWLPPGQDAPDRAIDHLFASRAAEVWDAAVLSGVTDASDHLPLRVELQLRG
jgi:endonuclease/exonuclease/phosphatase family metal-dependent hydrolase